MEMEMEVKSSGTIEMIGRIETGLGLFEVIEVTLLHHFRFVPPAVILN